MSARDEFRSLLPALGMAVLLPVPLLNFVADGTGRAFAFVYLFLGCALVAAEGFRPRDGGRWGAKMAAVGAAAASLSGHVRVGFENNFHLADGRIAPNNEALVRAMAELAGRIGRPLMTGDGLRQATEAGFRAL